MDGFRPALQRQTALLDNCKQRGSAVQNIDGADGNLFHLIKARGFEQMAQSATWNLADVWDAVADRRGSQLAQVHGDERVTWTNFRRNAEAVASFLVGAGVQRQASVAQFMHNGLAYLQTVYGAFSAALIPVNTNYRYKGEEVLDIWRDAEVSAVFFESELENVVNSVRQHLPSVKAWVCDGPSGSCPSWAHSFSEILSCKLPRRVPWDRSGDDLYLLYTGGTTGKPKGVMWRQDDLFRLLNERSPMPVDEDAGIGSIGAALDRPGPAVVVASPLMHGSGAIRAFSALNQGGTVITLMKHTLDPIEVFDCIDREHASVLAVVGDAFCLPLVATLEDERERWDLSSLGLITSGGAALSDSLARRLLSALPQVKIVDVFGSSEAPGIAQRTWSIQTGRAGPLFVPCGPTRVLGPSGSWTSPGALTPGLLGRAGPTALGYRNDAGLSYQVFKHIDGQRWVVPGDYAILNADGTIQILGRGNTVINSAGEKVFPGEIEDVIRELPLVLDVVVVGVPDERFGEAVAAAVVCFPEGNPSAIIISHVRSRLAAYKVPRHVIAVPSLWRQDSGKVDHGFWSSEVRRIIMARSKLADQL